MTANLTLSRIRTALTTPPAFPADAPKLKTNLNTNFLKVIAIIAMLIIYCLRGTSFAQPAGWVPALLASAAAVLLHLWKGNDLLSIFGATGLYMLLVQGVFG